ncbi:sulfotransferase domain-containing protein [Thalassovita sp.]|jgi:hypothetical protein|uniref:sulfotransferase domain-containing protein n=1 Tax=Thalassovita sp. TaxID=1979401 RepID=UPI003B5AF9F0
MTARPNFFIVGAPKCGTTAWAEYLRTHPQIGFARQKEPHYFNTDFPDFRWARSQADYLSFFEGCEGKTAIGEASVMYLYSSEAAANIARFDPGAKILIFLRDPVRFLPSYHNQLLLNLDEDIRDFGQAWALSGERAKALPSTCRDAKFLDYPAAARFAQQIQRYRAHFPDAQIKILRMEEWKPNPRAAYLDVLEFLGLPDDGRVDFPVIHKAKHHSSGAVAKLIQRPPGWALRVAAAVRRVLGLKRLGLSKLLRRMNTGTGYAKRDEENAELQDEIRAALAEDQALLQQIFKERSHG